MTPKQISKIWMLVSLAPLYYALNSYLVIQGGHEIFGAKLVTSDKTPAALVAIVICSVLLGIASSFGIDFARSGGARWADRIPLVALDEIDGAKWNARLYQSFMLFALSFLPATSLIHFWKVFATALVATTSDPPKPFDSIWNWGYLSKWDNPADVCTTLVPGPPASCTGKMTLLPGFEPAVLAAITGLAVATTLLFWVLVAYPKLWPRHDQPSADTATAADI